MGSGGVLRPRDSRGLHSLVPGRVEGPCQYRGSLHRYSARECGGPVEHLVARANAVVLLGRNRQCALGHCTDVQTNFPAHAVRWSIALNLLEKEPQYRYVVEKSGCFQCFYSTITLIKARKKRSDICR